MFEMDQRIWHKNWMIKKNDIKFEKDHKKKSIKICKR